MLWWAHVIASAFAVAPALGGATIVTSLSEARAVHNANLEPAPDAVLPGFRGVRTDESLGALRYDRGAPDGGFVASLTGLPNRTNNHVGICIPR